MLVFIRSVFGPELYRIYKFGQISQGRPYHKNKVEYYSSSILSMFHGFYILCKWTSPVLLAIAYQRGYMTHEGLYSLCRMACVLGGLYAVAYVTRGLGRCFNADYRKFVQQYAALNRNSAETFEDRKKFLSQYDFSTQYWQPLFISTVVPPPCNTNIPHLLWYDSPVATLKFLMWRFLSYLCVTTFGLRMMYPGVILGKFITKILQENRSKFIEGKRAIRAIIQTACPFRNRIDTLFIDNRRSGSENGKHLVICCDGNASFYEVGLFAIPIENGYSTLGWNTPGFCESTGLPYPEQVTAAADAVMQYALSLGFKVENIILMSWSIGGYAVSWLAQHYPEVRAVLVDACFDSVIPLAQHQMPAFASVFVEYAIKHNLNLNVAQLITAYSGPLLFIRRTQDEIISTTPRVPSTNRGNDLLIATLKHRYPHVFTDADILPYIRTWLSAKSENDRRRLFHSYTSQGDVACESLLSTHLREREGGAAGRYPLKIGADNALSRDERLALAMYLADKYLINYESTHCTPLPKDYMRMPWSEKELLERRLYSF